jgi:hypothetical protein
MSVEQREKKFFDEEWKKIKLRPITGSLIIPTIASVAGKRVLICSCGTGIEPVRAANAGAATYAFDISGVAAANARRIATHNGVKVEAVSTQILLRKNKVSELAGSAGRPAAFAQKRTQTAAALNP